MNTQWIFALIGGVLIGLAVSLMLVLNGRVTGISGIIYGLLKPVKSDLAWRIYFILGLLAGGLVYQFTSNSALSEAHVTSLNWSIPLAGLLVGFGTVLGSGCTSGHGVCGISRLSVRSLIATITFILAGVITVSIIRHYGVIL
ncbi:MAG: YeeE/YedE family protein [Pseudobdellovibrio sp.]|nr:YeeE/YedE family protein [Pseudobdellovibrio sp.]